MAALIKTLVVGPLQVNCCLVTDGASPEAMIVDPGGDADLIVEQVEADGLEPRSIVLTHCHGDHIGAAAALKRRFPEAQILAHEDDAPALLDADRNLSSMLGMPITTPPADRELSEGDEVAVGSLRFRVIHTPGHTPGGMGLYAETDPPLLLCGDTLFAGSIGRTDFPGGDHGQLIAGIRAKLLCLADDTRVITGHGPETTIGEERATNPFL